MQEKEPILKVEDLHFTYNGEKTALNGVDLNIYEGEKIADRKSTRLNSSHANISYAVFCLKKIFFF